MSELPPIRKLVHDIRNDLNVIATMAFMVTVLIDSQDNNPVDNQEKTNVDDEIKSSLEDMCKGRNLLSNKIGELCEILSETLAKNQVISSKFCVVKNNFSELINKEIDCTANGKLLKTEMEVFYKKVHDASSHLESLKQTMIDEGVYPL